LPRKVIGLELGFIHEIQQSQKDFDNLINFLSQLFHSITSDFFHRFFRPGMKFPECQGNKTIRGEP
jgi:hypothetical protein